MKSPSRRVLLLVLVAAFALSTVPGLAAAETRTGGTVIIGPEETTGDLEVFGGDVTVSGTVEGDLRAFAGNVRIDGTVTGDVEAAAGNVYISGTVQGDVRAGAGNVQIDEGGTVEGSLDAGASSVIIAGTINGDVRAGAETISLAPTASIEGNVEYDGILNRAEGAQVAGSISENTDLSVSGPIPQISEVFFSVYFFAVNLLVGAILLLAFPRFSNGLVDRTRERPGITGVVGLGTLIATPIALLLIAITIIGIPITLTGLFVYLIGIWLGIVYGRYVLGVWLLSLVDYENRWLALVVGMLVMVIITRVPVIGGLADFAVLIWGLGALAMGIYAAYRNRRSNGETGPKSAPEETAGDVEAA